MIFIGVGLAARGLYSEGSEYQDAVLAQTGRRTTALDMEPFAVNTERGRRQWRQLLLAIEHRVVLADKHPGMIADDLCDYLYARSTGHIGSLMTLINRGCQRAVRSGEEKLTTELLDNIKIDAASEKARQELELAINTGKVRVRCKAG
jgi:N-dimethylarginine dimethylaminohydrolase